MTVFSDAKTELSDEIWAWWRGVEKFGFRNVTQNDEEEKAEEGQGRLFRYRDPYHKIEGNLGKVLYEILISLNLGFNQVSRL